MDEFLLFIVVGFAAQMIDGAVGMTYGVSATTVMLSVGIPPATASASVHAAEVFTTGISGLSHWRFGNVQWSVVSRLAIPGMIGGALGAYVLTSVPMDIIKPIVTGYLLLMGLWIIFKALSTTIRTSEWPKWLAPLGFGGGFLDAVGGGGWGPMVASTLLGHGTTARYTIGSVNAAEFFVTLVISVTFLTTIGIELWPIIAGLILGGAAAAPLAAYSNYLLLVHPLSDASCCGIFTLREAQIVIESWRRHYNTIRPHASLIEPQHRRCSCP